MTTQAATGTDSTQAGVQAGTDGAPAGGTGATDDAAKAAADAAAAKAGDGELTLTAPEGFEFDEARLTEFKGVAKELKLPGEAAQKLVDLVSKHEKARFDAYAKQVNDWHEAVKADKELGGEKLQESAATARKALDLGPPELKEFLNTSGLGNHPLMFRWAHAVGKALSEDGNVVRGTAPTGEKSAADVLYGGTSGAKN